MTDSWEDIVNEGIPGLQANEELKVTITNDNTPAIDFIPDAPTEQQVVNVWRKQATEQCSQSSPNAVVKKELHYILNCVQTKGRNSNNIFISEQLKDPRFHQLGEYVHTLRNDAISFHDIRRSVGRLDEPLSRECREKFIKLQGILGNLADRIGNVLDMAPPKK